MVSSLLAVDSVLYTQVLRAEYAIQLGEHGILMFENEMIHVIV